MLSKSLRPSVSRPFARLGSGLGIFLLALLLRELVLHNTAGLPFVTFYPAVTASFLLLGIGPGALVALLGALAGQHYMAAQPAATMLLSTSMFTGAALLTGALTRRLQQVADAHRATAAALFASEQRLRAVIEDQGNALFRFRPDGQLSFVNPAFCALVGCTQEVLLGTRWQALLADDATFGWAPVAGHGGDSEATELETEVDFRLAGGRTARVHLVQRALFDEAGTWYESQVVGHDLTERIEAANEHQRLAGELEDLYNAAPCGYHSLDAQGRYVRINDTELAWLGCTREEVLGKLGPRDFFSPTSQAVFACTFPQILDNQPVHGLEVEMISRTGQHRWLTVSSRAVHDAEGRFLHTRTALFDITSKKVSDLRLRTLAGEQAAILDSGMFGACKVRERHITWANRGLEQMLGYHPGELTGLAVDELYPDQESFLAFGLHAYPLLQDGSTCHAELELRCKGGHTIWLDLNGQLIDPDTGTALWLSFDISDRKRLEARLLQSNAEISDLYDLAPCGYHSLDADGLYTRINATELAWLGCTEQDVLNRMSPADFFTEAGRALFRAHFPRMLREGQVDGLEMELVSLDGARRWVSVSATAVRDEHGRFVSTRSAMFDITERRAISEALRVAAEQTQDLYENAPCGYHSVGHDGKFRHINATELAWLGCTREEIFADRLGLTDFCTPASKAKLHALFPRLLRDGTREETDLQIVDRQGGLRDVSVTMSVVRDADGRLLHTRSVMVDITARREAERQVERLSARQTALLDSDLLGMAQVRNRLFVWASPGLERMLGHPAGFLRGQPTRLTHASMQGYAALATDAYTRIARGETYRGELPMRHADGHVLWVELTGGPFGDADDSLWLLTDISARKEVEQALVASQLLLERTGEVAGVGGWEFDLVTNAVTWSRHTHRLFEAPAGYQPTLEQALQLYTATSLPVITAALEAARTQGKGFDLQLQLRTLQGRLFWARIVGTAEHEHGQTRRIVGAFQDVTARCQIEQELAAIHELQRVTLDSIGDAVITTDCNGRVEWLNPVAERLTGWLKDEARGLPVAQVFHIVHEDTRHPVADPVAHCLGSQQVVALASQTVLLSRNGSEHGIEDSAAPIRSAQGNILGAVLVFHDVSEARRLNREMTHRATHDTLTGLVNREEFETRLGRLLERCQEDGSHHGVMYIDLDQFKLVNDACGHTVGDQLLRQLAGLLRDCVRSRDTVARLGGDEFGLILEHCGVECAQQVGKKICDLMEEFRFIHDGRRFRVGTSIGLVAMDACWSSVGAVLQAADTACYAAKDAGRNRVHVWYDTDAVLRARQGEAHWVNRLEQAMDEHQFVLFAQRIQPLGDAAQHGELHCEVLLRLREADGSLVLPSRFIAAAERFHMASRIDRWVVRTVFEQLQALGRAQLAAVQMVAINLSGQSIGDRAFHRDLADKVRNAGFDVRKLCFEITETSAITNLVEARAFIEEMRAMGVQIALDDFGAGASSFGYLKSLPVDLLKIDGQFIRDLLSDPLDIAAVRCFRDVAQVVGMRTVAEFVERPEVLALLVDLGIDFAQGYLMHRPESLDTLLGTPLAATSGASA